MKHDTSAPVLCTVSVLRTSLRHCTRCGGLTPLVCGFCAPINVPLCSATACRDAHEAEVGCVR